MTFLDTLLEPYISLQSKRSNSRHEVSFFISIQKVFGTRASANWHPYPALRQVISQQSYNFHSEPIMSNSSSMEFFACPMNFPPLWIILTFLSTILRLALMTFQKLRRRNLKKTCPRLRSCHLVPKSWTMIQEPWGMFNSQKANQNPRRFTGVEPCHNGSRI